MAKNVQLEKWLKSTFLKFFLAILTTLRRCFNGEFFNKRRFQGHSYKKNYVMHTDIFDYLEKLIRIFFPLVSFSSKIQFQGQTVSLFHLALLSEFRLLCVCCVGTLLSQKRRPTTSIFLIAYLLRYLRNHVKTLDLFYGKNSKCFFKNTKDSKIFIKPQPAHKCKRVKKWKNSAINCVGF